MTVFAQKDACIPHEHHYRHRHRLRRSLYECESITLCATAMLLLLSFFTHKCIIFTSVAILCCERTLFLVLLGIFVDWVRGKFSSWHSLFILVFYSTHPSLTPSIFPCTSPAYLCAASLSVVGSFFAPSSHFVLLTCTP